MKKKIKQDVLRKKVISCILIAGLVLSLTACGGKEFGNHEKGVANPDRSQTEFAIMGAQSALSRAMMIISYLTGFRKMRGFVLSGLS